MGGHQADVAEQGARRASWDGRRVLNGICWVLRSGVARSAGLLFCSGQPMHFCSGVDNSALAQWFRVRTENARGTRKTMIVALARKLLIALWRLVREGVVPDGVILRPAK